MILANQTIQFRSMKLIISSLVILFLSFSTFAQDEWNQKDAQGRKQGKWVEVWENSTIKKYQGQFKNDKPYGKFTFWYESGKPRALMNYSEDGKVARVVFFHDNGKMMAEGKYVNKVKDSTWVHYDIRERLSYQETYVNGKLSGERLVYFVDGTASGLPGSSQFTEGKVHRKEHYKNGILHGEFETYYYDGAVKQKGEYVDGNMDGRITYFYPNGRKEKIETYKYAVKHGLFMVFDKDGTEQGRLFYQEGKLLEGKALENYLKNAKKK